MSQQLRALAAFTEDPGLFRSNHMASGDLMLSSGNCTLCTYPYGDTQTLKNNNIKLKRDT